MQPQLFFLYTAASLVIGYLGREKTLKFWGHFLLSFLLSPVIGLLALGIEEWIFQRKVTKEDPAVVHTHDPEPVHVVHEPARKHSAATAT